MFQPLANEVWLAHAAFLVVSGLVLALIEGTNPDRPGPGCGGGRRAGCGPGALLESVHTAAAHFLWNNPRHEPRTLAGRLVLLALCFHAVVVAASYTASLTSFLATSFPQVCGRRRGGAGLRLTAAPLSLKDPAGPARGGPSAYSVPLTRKPCLARAADTETLFSERGLGR